MHSPWLDINWKDEPDDPDAWKKSADEGDEHTSPPAPKRDPRVKSSIEEFRGLRPSNITIGHSMPGTNSVKTEKDLVAIQIVVDKMRVLVEATRETWEFSTSRNLWISINTK